MSGQLIDFVFLIDEWAQSERERIRLEAEVYQLRIVSKGEEWSDQLSELKREKEKLERQRDQTKSKVKKAFIIALYSLWLSA